MTSIFLGVKHAAPAMERSGGGAIVNLSSVHGLLMAPRKLVYEAGKSAVIGMTRQIAIDFGPLGIRVNAIFFLCSEVASFITGQALAVDGGLTLQLQEDLGVDMAYHQREHPDTWLPY